jgi:hypothetical protein
LAKSNEQYDDKEARQRFEAALKGAMKTPQTRRRDAITPNAIVEKFVTRANGGLELLTEGSTRPIASTVTHTGIYKVKRYAFNMD